MSAARHAPAVPFRQLLSETDQPGLLAGTLMQLWLVQANINGANHPQADDRQVAHWLPQLAQTGCEDVLWKTARQGEQADLLVAASTIQRLPSQQRQDLLTQTLAMVGQFEQLGQAANHVLRLLAELCGIGEVELNAKYFKAVGHSLPELGDLSSPQWWRETNRQGASTEQWLDYSLETLSRRQARDILGVADSATDAEVKQAYRRLIHNYHPDRNPGMDDHKSEKLFQLVRRAYEVLKA